MVHPGRCDPARAGAAGAGAGEYAMTDAVFVVITLAWLLTTHS
jgi:hypothetical protein